MKSCVWVMLQFTVCWLKCKKQSTWSELLEWWHPRGAAVGEHVCTETGKRRSEVRVNQGHTGNALRRAVQTWTVWILWLELTAFCQPPAFSMCSICWQVRAESLWQQVPRDEAEQSCADFVYLQPEFTTSTNVSQEEVQNLFYLATKFK